MKHMISSSFKIKGDVISDHLLMIWFQKESPDTVGFKTFRTFFFGGGKGSQIKSWILVDQSVIWIPKCTGGGTYLENFLKFYHFFSALLKPNKLRQTFDKWYMKT